MVQEALGNVTAVEEEANAHMNTIYKGLNMAELGINSAVRTTENMEENLEYQENKKKRKVWEIMEVHRGKIDYDKMLKEQHELLLKANIYHQEKLDTLDLNRIDDEIGGVYNGISRAAEGLRGRIGANMSIYKHSSLENLHALGNYSAQEREDFHLAYLRAMKLHGESLISANDTATFESAVNSYQKEINARQKSIYDEIGNFHTVTDGIGKLELKMNATKMSEDEQIQKLETKFDFIKEKLAALV